MPATHILTINSGSQQLDVAAAHILTINGGSQQPGVAVAHILTIKSRKEDTRVSVRIATDMNDMTNTNDALKPADKWP